ncbi:MAG: tetratricopeptide repeat protein [bacterium]|nr:tetratricopeptide repeat protein [bacterium]
MGKRSREKRERRGQVEERPEKSSGEVSVEHSRLEKIYFAVIEWGVYLSLFAPFVLLKGYFFPYVVPKTIFFRIIVDVILIAYVLLAISNSRYRPKMNALTISIIVFMAIAVLTSITGVNFEKSFWSTFERMTGLLTFFHLFAFFIVLTSVFKERKNWERILTLSIIVGVFISFYTLTNKETSSWGGGTIGNVSFLASYLLFDIFFAAILFFIKRGGWKIFYAITFIILLLPMFINTEIPRGGIASFFIGIFLLGLGYMVFSGRKLLKRLAPVVFLVVVLAGIGILQNDLFKAKMFDVKEIPEQARETVWRISYEGFLAKPWLGWGMENYNIAFLNYFDPEVPLSVDIWYDRAHNIVLDSLVSTGIVGTVSLLAIFTVAITSLLRLCSRIAERRNILFPLGMATVLIVYFIQDIWVFDMISSYMMLFLSLAFISFLVSPKKEPEMVPAKRSSFSPVLGALLILLALFSIYFGNIQPARASQYTVQGMSTSPLENAIPFFQKALAMSPMTIFEIPEQFSRKTTGLTFDENQDKSVLMNAFELSIVGMERSIAQGPNDFRLHLVLGRQHNDFFYLTQDSQKLEKAADLLNKAIELSPGNQQGYWALAQTRLYQGRPEEAFSLIQQSIDLEPRFLDSHWYLAMSYRLADRYDLAAEELERMLEIEGLEDPLPFWERDMSRLEKAIGIYQQLEDDERLIELYQAGMRMKPGDGKFYAAAAVSYANLGDFDKAREMAQKAIELNPEYAEDLESFLNQLPQ